jgi:ABC-type enterochelin transport system ATPase subunit
MTAAERQHAATDVRIENVTKRFDGVVAVDDLSVEIERGSFFAIVLGASLLTLFLSMSVPLGFDTILIAHIMFSISYVVVTVKARLIGFDRHLEEAAMDLGANELTTFRKVTSR